jgi:hypothetical protein
MKYDLLLTGGEVIDPAANLRGVMDIAIAGGKIAAVGPSLPANEALRTISAKGRIVTPGLVDIHAHVFVNAHDMGGHTCWITRCAPGFAPSSIFPRSASPAPRAAASFPIFPTRTLRAAQERSRRTPISRSA